MESRNNHGSGTPTINQGVPQKGLVTHKVDTMLASHALQHLRALVLSLVNPLCLVHDFCAVFRIV
jgi:hypothetical protein